jgi:hypothetical protein|tara:strand:+ start:942 stop:1160 length:219 start_codon:yes stop_codon:yes gene_type:complete
MENQNNYNYLKKINKKKVLEELLKDDLEDVRLQKIEKPKLVRQSARQYSSSDELYDLLVNYSLKKTGNNKIK